MSLHFFGRQMRTSFIENRIKPAKGTGDTQAPAHLNQKFGDTKKDGKEQKTSRISLLPKD
jgi:hypothetical protein